MPWRPASSVRGKTKQGLLPVGRRLLLACRRAGGAARPVPALILGRWPPRFAPLSLCSPTTWGTGPKKGRATWRRRRLNQPSKTRPPLGFAQRFAATGGGCLSARPCASRRCQDDSTPAGRQRPAPPFAARRALAHIRFVEHRWTGVCTACAQSPRLMRGGGATLWLPLEIFAHEQARHWPRSAAWGRRGAADL